jgi:hypothetical protein
MEICGYFPQVIHRGVIGSNPLHILYMINIGYTLHIPPTFYPQIVDIFGHITKGLIFSWNFTEFGIIK